ncbi:MAG: Fur family transcriptional regulator [Anaerolineae bacterium]
MAETVEQRLERLAERLRAKGGRVTSERLAVLRVLAEDASHPSVEDVYRRVAGELPSISLATVYKTVATLQEMGEVVELAAVNATSRYDGRNPFPHPHLICSACGAIADLPGESAGRLLCLASEPASGWQLTPRVDFWGLCPECLKAK